MTRYKPCPRCRENGKDTRGDNLVLYADGGGHCFSCGFHLFPLAYVPVTHKEKINVPKTLLPRDFTREVPAAALRWLLQYGLPWSYWKDQIGFSPKEERLVFLVGDPMQFSIGRYVGNKEPSLARKWYVWGDPHKHCEAISVGQSHRPGTVVLVEDLISAHKVATSGYTSIPLFGTEVHKPHLYYLMQEAKNVVFWLDKDQGGSIMRKAVGLQTLLNIPVSTMQTDKDPKALRLDEIVERLQ